MENQIEKFDPSKLMQGVKDRIKATFVSLIPDGEWDSMVQKEVEAFFNTEEILIFAEKDKYKEGQWHSTKFATLEIKQSPFRALVWEHCYQMTINVLKEKIDKDYFNNVWSPNEETLDEKMKGFIKEAAPNAINMFFEKALFNQADYLRNTLMNNH